MKLDVSWVKATFKVADVFGLIILNGIAKMKLAILKFLYRGKIVENTIVYIVLVST